MLRKATFVGLGVGLTATFGAFAAGPFFAPEPPMTPGEPFTAVAQTRSTTNFADGNRIVRTNTVHYFRDGQGRVRVERANGRAANLTSTSGGSMVPVSESVSIDDPVSGEHFTVIPQMKSVAEFKLPQGPRLKAMGRVTVGADLDVTAPFGLLGLGMGIGADGRTTESSAETTSLGQKVVNGVMATGTRIVRVIPAGALGNDKPIASTLEEWKSAELGIPVQISEQSSLGGDLRFDLEDVQRAEPDASLFTVPADYKRLNLSQPAATAMVPAATGTATAVKKP